MGLLVGIVAGGAAEAGDTASVRVQVKWDGDATTCRFGLLGKTLNHPLEDTLEVPAGKARIAVRCGTDPQLSPPPKLITARAGRTQVAKFKLQEARVRVMSKNGGSMRPGEVRFYEVGRAEQDPPVAVHPTNVTAKVAAGRYDVRVRLKDGPERIHKKLELKSGRNRDLNVDLSDGALLGLVTDNGRTSDGAVRVMRGAKKVALGDTGQEISLPAGFYEVVLELRTAANFATRSKKVWVEPGKTTRVKQAFKTGKIQARITQDGKAIEATVRLSLPLAADFFNFFEAPGPVALTPGRYNVTIEAPAAKALGALKKADVEVKAGRTTKVAFDVSQATLRASITKNGRKIPGIVEVREPGGGKVVARMSKTGVRLWPGRYEVVARLPDGSESVDGPFDLKLGEKVHRTIAFRRANLTVLALRGPAPEPQAQVQVYRRGAAKPLAKGRHGEAIELPEGTYDLKVLAGADTVWSQGVEVRGRRKVQVALPELADADALPEGEDPADDFELPEGDAD